MQMDAQTSAAGSGRPLFRARRKSVKIQQQLAVAGAELELTNAVLDHTLPESVKHSSDVQRALSQNGVIEEKVQQAAEELKEMSTLLEEEVADRERLERELARSPAP